MPKPFLSLILPVRDNADTVLDSLMGIDYALSLSAFSSEVLVVDDGSRDATGIIAQRFGKIAKDVRVIEGKHPRGLGWAVQEGMASAKGNIRLILTEPCLPSLVLREHLLASFQKGSDMVGIAPSVSGIVRKYAYRVLSGKKKLPFDPQFGILGMTEDAAVSLFRTTELSLKSGIFLELLLRASAFSLRISALSCDTCARLPLVPFLWDALRIRIRGVGTSKE